MKVRMERQSRRVRSSRGLVLGVIVGAALFVSSAGAFDRRPVTLGGLHFDGWFQTVTNAERSLHYRYFGIHTVSCTGVFMSGHESESWLLQSGVRWWDKLSCRGTAYWNGLHPFTLIFDQKSRLSWTIYRLTGLDIHSLSGEGQ